MALIELDCLDKDLSLEDLLSLITECDGSGNVSWNVVVEPASGDCHSCSQYKSIEDLLRKSIVYDDVAQKWAIRVNSLT